MTAEFCEIKYLLTTSKLCIFIFSNGSFARLCRIVVLSC
jgi:hypothetical protein